MSKLIVRRFLFSRSKSPLVVSEEIQHALSTKSAPVISLESTIITHGMAFPANLEMALKVEETVRKNGGIPATVGFIEGKPNVGLSKHQLTELAEKAREKGIVNKVSRRDIGYTMARKLYGGTTIASTMILSHMAGIKVFATGGLGGVHYDAQRTFDISADLTELGRTPVAVVCSGPKSILDIGLTIEYLETQGVFVSTYNDDNRSKVEIPGFYARESGVASPNQFSSFEDIALTLHNHNEIMQLKSGSVICVPVPKPYAMSSSFINGLVQEAIQDANQVGISGKELTPYLLKRISTATKGKSVESNIELVLNNAKIATNIGKELLSIERGISNSSKEVFQPPVTQHAIASSTKEILVDSKEEGGVAVAVIGSVAYDTISKLNPQVRMKDSNIGSIRGSIGGVGFNVNLACTYVSANTNISSRFISVVGQDLPGVTILNELKQKGINSSSIKIIKDNNIATAQYNAAHNESGELIVACADMSIIEQDFSNHIIEELNKLNPKVIVFDSNLQPSIIDKVLHMVRRDKSRNVSVIIEPTSYAKAGRIAHISHGVFPHNVINLITPTTNEIEAIHASFADNNYFDDFDNWFPLLDSLGINSDFREKLNAISRKQEYTVLADMIAQGTLQRSFQILPYVQNMLIKLGDRGVIFLSISESIDDYKSIPTTSPYKPKFTLTSRGTKISDSKRMGAVLQYFPIPKENENLDIKNVTGAGDSLLGTLIAKLGTTIEQNNWLKPSISSIEQEWDKWEAIYKAQLSSGLTLTSESSVSKEIRNL
ncbi:uncharacterized protein RJT21DRAFT_17794 [Scheffersomyces amazonensis]|uniref:uncharacterized protein n=1 Tax=Scheffersomyces amazonensis TaxID=1078765 RepID=UPI00315DE256